MRTVLAAVLGWVIIASGWAITQRLPKVIRLIGLLSWCLMIVSSALALPASYGNQQQPRWPELSTTLADLAILGKPILVFSTAGMMTDVIDLYAEIASKV